MFETIKTIREAFDVSSWTFILISTALGAVLFFVGGWVVDRIYQKGIHALPTPPAQTASTSGTPGPAPLTSTKAAKTDLNENKRSSRSPSHNGNISQVSNAPYSSNIVAGDQAQITINNPPPNPYGAVVTWDYNGAKRSQSGGSISVVTGDELGTFQTLLRLESQEDWHALLESSNEQIKRSPSWPTPYLFASEANAHLGNLPLARQQLAAVERTVSDNPGYATHISKVAELLASH